MFLHISLLSGLHREEQRCGHCFSPCLALRSKLRFAEIQIYLFFCILNEYGLVFLDHFNMLMSKMIFKKWKNIILMYFGTKSTLKSYCNRTPKQALIKLYFIFLYAAVGYFSILIFKLVFKKIFLNKNIFHYYSHPTSYYYCVSWVVHGTRIKKHTCIHIPFLAPPALENGTELFFSSPFWQYAEIS